MLPRLTQLSRNATHRLIPERYTSGNESVLARLTSDPSNLQAIFQLEGASNDRLLGEAALLPGISVRELVFGLSYSHIVNAAFTHARPGGSRFNGPDRGAWYAGFSRKTSEREVAYHRGKELQEISWPEKEIFMYVDFLSDFRGPFHDLRETTKFSGCLDPDSYAASQALAQQLLDAGSAGIVYPSVRHKSGTCLACFRPALVNNVRKGDRITITFANFAASPSIETAN